MKALGSKTAARELMQQAGVPMVPGTTSPIKKQDKAIYTAKQLGYPVLVKAVHGGGGKGMRKVDKEDDLEQAIQQAQSESLKAFGSTDVFIEKYLNNPRHIEIQVLADMHDNIIFLGEKECSIQRRHQKVIEECPSSNLSQVLRDEMGKSAVNAARQCGYVNAGTVEFLVDATNSFYFLEMNTRLQVEHPITELVYGIDLVKAQIKIAQGEKLLYAQEDMVPRGHAIECRICAEDSNNNFLPSTGTIEEYAPSEGPGIAMIPGVARGTSRTAFLRPLTGEVDSLGHGS